MMFSTRTVIIEGGDVLLPGREEGSLKLKKKKRKAKKLYTQWAGSSAVFFTGRYE